MNDLPKKPHYPLTRGEAILGLFTLSLYDSGSCDSLFQSKKGGEAD